MYVGVDIHRKDGELPKLNENENINTTNKDVSSPLFGRAISEKKMYIFHVQRNIFFYKFKTKQNAWLLSDISTLICYGK